MEFVIALSVLVVFGVLVIRNAIVTSRDRRTDRRGRAASTGDLVRVSIDLPSHVPHVPHRASHDVGQNAVRS